MRCPALRSTALVTLAMALLAAPGCSPLFKKFVYTCDRVMDASDMLDLGITVTPRLSASAYVSLQALGGVGYGLMDGYFSGIGDSRIGTFRRYYKSSGWVLYSYEESAWRDFDTTKPSTLTRRQGGLLGWFYYPPLEGQREPRELGRPRSVLAAGADLHLGYLGITAKVDIVAVLDFLVGLTGYDVCKDDWATRIADEERALNGLDTGKPKEPVREPAEKPAREPPKASPAKPKPPEDSPPEKPKKDSPPRHRKHDLRNIIP